MIADLHTFVVSAVNPLQQGNASVQVLADAQTPNKLTVKSPQHTDPVPGILPNVVHGITVEHFPAELITNGGHRVLYLWVLRPLQYSFFSIRTNTLEKVLILLQQLKQIYLLFYVMMFLILAFYLDIILCS